MRQQESCEHCSLEEKYQSIRFPEHISRKLGNYLKCHPERFRASQQQGHQMKIRNRAEPRRQCKDGATRARDGMNPTSRAITQKLGNTFGASCGCHTRCQADKNRYYTFDLSR
ncbi:hypothetical protein TNIN_33961 [Trichonephila inaurata madagascariensis]|uniref:Uncharacterized protein n=2 Tax=Trichonephila inaurata madagascariensis TaxID=2747483 RepID=A0A8X6MC27_9ARAC|nr:hypothetical protein TNIN_33961 [Trichonephila inaurata madagascariensis]